MGLMHITGPRDGPPVKVGVAVTDLTTGMYAVNSILAALIERGRSGMGQHLDVCLSDCQVATLSNMAQSVLVTGKKDGGRYGTSHRKRNPQRLAPTLWGSDLTNTPFSVGCPLSCVPNERWGYPHRWCKRPTLWHSCYVSWPSPMVSR